MDYIEAYSKCSDGREVVQEVKKFVEFEKQVNNFLCEHKDKIVVRDIKYTAEYPNPHNAAWQNWTDRKSVV